MLMALATSCVLFLFWNGELWKLKMEHDCDCSKKKVDLRGSAKKVLKCIDGNFYKLWTKGIFK